jgi:hypothetical protein
VDIVGIAGAVVVEVVAVVGVALVGLAGLPLDPAFAPLGGLAAVLPAIGVAVSALVPLSSSPVLELHAVTASKPHKKQLHSLNRRG